MHILEFHASRLSSASRLDALRATGLLDDTTNDVLDRLARLATTLLGAPIAAVSLVTDDAQYFTGLAGMTGWAADARGTPIAYSFCQHVVASATDFVVNDARHSPLVQESPGYHELQVVAYAGVPLTTRDGETLGAFCAIDSEPRQWTAEQLGTLRDLASAAMSEIELSGTLRTLARSHQELLSAQQRLREQATRDELTGPFNRRGFGDLARQQLASATRTGTHSLLVNLDLDEFKGINDRLGHDAGDQALCEMAAVLKQVFRAADVIARVGGDEFVVLVSDASRDEAERVVGRLRAALDERNAMPGRDYQLHTSVGLATFDPAAPVSLAVLLRTADAEMYEQKRAAQRAGAAA